MVSAGLDRRAVRKTHKLSHRDIRFCYYGTMLTRMRRRVGRGPLGLLLSMALFAFAGNAVLQHAFFSREVFNCH